MARDPMRWAAPERSRLTTSPRTYELRRSGAVLAIVQERAGRGWFWYTMGRDLPRRNTASEPLLSLDGAKAEAQAFVRAALPPAGGR